MTKCNQHVWMTDQEMKDNGVFSAIIRTCKICGTRVPWAIVRVERMPDRGYQRIVECKEHRWKCYYRKWRKFGFSPETSIPTELYRLCERCGKEELKYSRIIKGVYPLGSREEKKQDLLKEYLSTKT